MIIPSKANQLHHTHLVYYNFRKNTITFTCAFSYGIITEVLFLFKFVFIFVHSGIKYAYANLMPLISIFSDRVFQIVETIRAASGLRVKPPAGTIKPNNMSIAPGFLSETMLIFIWIIIISSSKHALACALLAYAITNTNHFPSIITALLP